MDEFQNISRRQLLALSMATLATAVPVRGHAFRSREKRIAVLGVGGAGGNMVNHMGMQGVSQATLAHANAKDVIRSFDGVLTIPLEIPETSLQISLRESIHQNAEKLAWNAYSALPEMDRLILVAGLGGRIGSCVTPAVAQIAKQAGVQVFGLVFLPFSWEGDRRHGERAAQGLGAVKRVVDALRVIDLEKASQEVPAEISMDKFFELQDSSGVRMINEYLSMA